MPGQPASEQTLVPVLGALLPQSLRVTPPPQTHCSVGRQAGWAGPGSVESRGRCALGPVGWVNPLQGDRVTIRAAFEREAGALSGVGQGGRGQVCGQVCRSKVARWRMLPSALRLRFPVRAQRAPPGLIARWWGIFDNTVIEKNL